MQGRIAKRKEQAAQDLVDGKTKVPDYIVKEGLRYVEKYTYVFRTFVKGRWVGQKVIDLMIKEFISNGDEGMHLFLFVEYYRRAIDEGRIQINGLPTTPEYVIQMPDELSIKKY